MRGQSPTRPEYDLYWGDFHKHLTGPDVEMDRLDEVLEQARAHLDVTTVLCYPFKWFRKGRDPGVREESVGTYPEFETWWEEIQDLSARYNDPGGFVTFPAYEWHGNRTEWGDHNVIYFEEGAPLADTWDLPDLYDFLEDRDAFAIPHHTAYRVADRGRDWSVYEPSLSPIMEVFSSHGSSEGVHTPVPMDGNTSMGPRTSGTTFQDALDRGHRIGAIASNDGPGVPGTWGHGLAGVWAESLTREAIWEAIADRRTYGVTGDRMSMWWAVDGAPLGSVLDGPVESGTAVVDCPQPLDRIDLIHDGSMIDRYTHDRGDESDDGVYRQLIEFGWGPTERYGGFSDVEMAWNGEIRIEDGQLESVTPRFVGYGQRYRHRDERTCEFELTTTRGEYDTTLPEGNVDQVKQGLMLELDGTDTTVVRIELADGETFAVSIGEARDRAHLFPLTDESIARIEREFDVSAGAFENPDPFYHNARKVKVHPAHPVADCRATVEFDLPTTDDEDYYYVRAAQVNGQYGWSSPVWAT